MSPLLFSYSPRNLDYADNKDFQRELLYVVRFCTPGVQLGHFLFPKTLKVSSISKMMSFFSFTT